MDLKKAKVFEQFTSKPCFIIQQSPSQGSDTYFGVIKFDLSTSKKILGKFLNCNCTIVD